MSRRKVLFYTWLARKMPKRMVYFAALGLLANVTTQGKMRFRVVPDIGAMEAIGDYARRYRLEGR